MTIHVVNNVKLVKPLPYAHVSPVNQTESTHQPVTVKLVIMKIIPLIVTLVTSDVNFVLLVLNTVPFVPVIE
jgi:hypothetical protein